MAVCYSVLQCVTVCCSVLQCVAEYCSVLQCVAVGPSLEYMDACCIRIIINTMRTDFFSTTCVAVCCSVLQRVAVP